MRLVPACLVALALLWGPGRCQQGGPPEREEVVGFSEDEDIDVQRLLGDLLAGETNETFSSIGRNEKDGVGGSLEEPAADAAVVARRNELVDAFLARLSDAIKQSHDPMKIVFKKSGKVILRPEGKNKRNKKKFRRRLHKKGKRGKKGRGGRHPKSLTPQQEQEEKNKILGEERENGEDGAAADDEDTLSEADGEEEAGVEFYVYDEDAEEGRPVANETEGRRPLDEADYEDEDSALEATREGRGLAEADAEAEAEVSPDEGRARRRRKKGARGRCGKVCRRRRKIRRRRRNQKRKVNRKGPRGRRPGPRPRALVSGISLIRRAGDVRVSKQGATENIEADIELGPIVLQAERTFQTGVQPQTRQAEARTAVVKGELGLSLAPEGDVSLERLDLIRPEVIEVTGNLSRRSGTSSGRFMKTYMSKTQPLIVLKIKKAANRLLRLSNRNPGFLKRGQA